MPQFQGREMSPDEYIAARLGIAPPTPTNWKPKMVVMAHLLGRWRDALTSTIMGVYDDAYDVHVSDLFDAWARGELDILDCAQRQIAYEASRGLVDERGSPRDVTD